MAAISSGSSSSRSGPTDRRRARRAGLGEARQLPLRLVDEVGRRAQVLEERLAHEAAHLVDVAADERVQHQRDVAVAGVPGGAVRRRGRRRRSATRSSSLITEQVGEDVGAHPAGHREGVRAAAGGDPDRRRALDRRREHAHLDRRGRRRCATGTDSPRHSARTVSMPSAISSRRSLEVLGREREVVGVPAGGERQPDAAVRQVVDDRPLLGARGSGCAAAARRCRRGSRRAR